MEFFLILVEAGLDEMLKYTCEYCGKSFSSYYKRKTHMKEHKDQQVGGGQFACEAFENDVV